MSEVVEKEVKVRKPRAKKEDKKVEAVIATPEVIDWRAKIPEDFIDIQTNWLVKNGINPADLTAEERKELKERAGDENLVIRLGGFKHLAHLAGIQSIKYDVISINDEIGKVSVQCTLGFNNPSLPQEASGLANASKENTNYPFNMFLESMAENRSFSRACRSAFNINILGAEEIQPSSAEFTQDTLLSDDEGCASPQESLRILIENTKGKTFADLKQSLIKKEWANSESWNDFKDIPADQCLVIINTILNGPTAK